MQLKDGKAVRDFLSPRLQSALIKTALNSIQKSPQMLGVKHQNTLAIVSAVAGAIADDKHKLLGDDDWLIIAEVMASVAATDMGRLAFDAINAAAEGEGVEALKSLMSSVVQETIAAATDAWADELNQNVHNFSLHKDTLRKSIVLMLNALRGNIIGLKQTTGLIESYLSSILNYAKTHGDKIGSDTFLSILDTTVATVLMTGDLPNIEQFVSKLEAQT